jgi:hypothetical protein
MTTLPPPDLPVNSGGQNVTGPPPIIHDASSGNATGPSAAGASAAGAGANVAEVKVAGSSSGAGGSTVSRTGDSLSKSHRNVSGDSQSFALQSSADMPDGLAKGAAIGPLSDSLVSEPKRPGLFSQFKSFTQTTAFLVSFVIHLLLLLLLAVLFLQADYLGSGRMEIDAVIDRSEPLAIETLPQDQSLQEGTLTTAVESNSNTKTTLDAESLSPPSPSQLSANKPIPLLDLLAASAQQSVVDEFRNSSVAQRQAGQRAAAAAANGGSRESELAVEKGLKWLIAHQNGDGSWNLQYRNDRCGPGCDHEGREGDYAPAATGLALLSFLGAGYSHREGPYQQELRKAIYYLITRIEYSENEAVGNLAGVSEHAMYNHGIATLALCEALQMTKDKDLEQPVRSLIQYTVQAQHDVGGWGYSAATPGDLTISAWQVMSIKSAHSAGIRVPSDVMRRFDRFLDTQQSGGGAFYGYRGPGKQPGTTAMGLLLRMYRGWFRTDPRLLEGMNYLEKAGVSTTDVYFNFYATQVFFHQAGAAWTGWNNEVRDFLIKRQEQSGHEEGSWSMQDSFSKVGGRLYCTCLSILTLEVYYRYPPMFREITADGFEF